MRPIVTQPAANRTGLLLVCALAGSLLACGGQVRDEGSKTAAGDDGDAAAATSDVSSGPDVDATPGPDDASFTMPETWTAIDAFGFPCKEMGTACSPVKSGREALLQLFEKCGFECSRVTISVDPDGCPLLVSYEPTPAGSAKWCVMDGIMGRRWPCGPYIQAQAPCWE